MKWIICTVTLVVCFMGVAKGQRSNLSDEARKAILEYPLAMSRANQLIGALEEMTKYVASLPDYAERIKKSMAILKKNQLTAKDYIVGVPTLRMALLVAVGTPQSPNVVASPANVAFAKANYSTLKPKMDAAVGNTHGDSFRKVHG